MAFWQAVATANASLKQLWQIEEPTSRADAASLFAEVVPTSCNLLQGPRNVVETIIWMRNRTGARQIMLGLVELSAHQNLRQESCVRRELEYVPYFPRAFRLHTEVAIIQGLILCM